MSPFELSVRIHAGASTWQQGTDADYLPRLDALERRETFWNDRKEILNSVRPRPNDQHGNLFGSQILLVGQVFVERSQDIKLRIGQAQQLAVLFA